MRNVEGIWLPSIDEVREAIGRELDKNDMTQKDLASYLDTSETTLSGFMNGNRTFAYETVYEAWRLFQQEDTGEGLTARDIMWESIVWADPDATYDEVAEIMMQNAYTQMPVREDGELLGWITTERLAENATPGEPIREYIYQGPFATIDAFVGEDAVRDALTGDSSCRALLVSDDGEYVGIITREDLVRVQVEDGQ
jgi:predicted transcriptional regulator